MCWCCGRGRHHDGATRVYSCSVRGVLIVFCSCEAPLNLCGRQHLEVCSCAILAEMCSRAVHTAACDPPFGCNAQPVLDQVCLMALRQAHAQGGASMLPLQQSKHTTHARWARPTHGTPPQAHSPTPACQRMILSWNRTASIIAAATRSPFWKPPTARCPRQYTSKSVSNWWKPLRLISRQLQDLDCVS